MIKKRIEVAGGDIMVSLAITSFVAVGRKYGVFIEKQNHVTDGKKGRVTLFWQGNPANMKKFEDEIQRGFPALKMNG